MYDMSVWSFHSKEKTFQVVEILSFSQTSRILQILAHFDREVAPHKHGDLMEISEWFFVWERFLTFPGASWAY